MLVLSRKQNEAIVFSTPQGEEIVVRVVRVNGDKVRLGIECDKNVSIHREEVFNEIKRHAELMDSPKKELENEMDLDNLGNLIVRRSHLELLMGAINNMTVVANGEYSLSDPFPMGAINNMTVVANGEGAIITTDDGVTKQNWDIKPTKSNFDALGDDEDGCGPDGNYVDQ